MLCPKTGIRAEYSYWNWCGVMATSTVLRWRTLTSEPEPFSLSKEKLKMSLSSLPHRNTSSILPASLLVFYIFQIQKGKVHGSIDVGLSVMSIKKKARRIDLDTEEHIYHLKVKLLFSSFAAIIRGDHLPVSEVNRVLVSPLPSPLVRCFRWNPRTGLMPGSPNFAIIACTGRMRLWGPQEMLVFTYFLQPPQLNPHQLLMFLS